MAIEWSGYSHNLRLGIYVVGNTMIVYLESNKYGFNFSNGTLSFSGDASGSKTVGFYSGTGQSVRKEVHRWSIGTGSYTATVAFNHTIGGVGTISLSKTRTRTVTPKPTAPSNISVARNSDSSHTVSWTRNATATSVRLERRTNGGAWQHVSSVSSNAASITDTTTKAGNRYQYRVRVVNAGGTSDWSNLSSVVYTTPPVPTGITATRVGDNIRVNGTVSANASHVDIQDDGTQVVGSLTKGSLPWTHSSPNQATTHRYRMRARVNPGVSNSTLLTSGWSSYSATVQLTAPPSAPTGLNPNGLTVESGSVITVAWRHNPVDSSEQSAYELRFRVDGGAWNTLTGLSASSRTITVGLGVFEYQVRTKGAHPDWSPWSAVATVTVVDRPTVAILSPDAGQFFEAVLPVTWSFFQGQGRPQSAWRARLLRDGQLLETKQGTGSASSTTFSHRLEDGRSYTVEVDAASGSIWSAVESVTVDASFILPAPAALEGVWNDSTGAVDLQVSVLEQTPRAEVVNLAPRIEGTGTTVEVQRNYFTGDPGRRWAVSTGIAYWAGTGGTGSLEAWGRASFKSGFATRLRVTGGTGTDGNIGVQTNFAESARIAGSGRVTFEFTIEATSAGIATPTITAVGVTLVDSMVLAPLQAGVPVRVWVTVEKSSPFLSTDQLRVNYRLQGTDRTIFIGDVDAYPGARQTGRAYADGDYSPYFGLEPRWLGAANESVSVLEGEPVSGWTAYDGFAFLVERHGVQGIGFLASGTNNYSGVRFTIPAVARSSGTFLATFTLDDVLGGGQASTARSVRVVNPSQLVQAPNVVGEHGLRLFYGGLTGTYHAMLHSGTVRESGVSYWFNVALMSGDYNGEFFDGDTEWVQIDGVWMHTRWNSDGTSTASMPDTVVSLSVERSVDDGVSWEPVLVDETGVVQVADHEALSNGVTIYRVTTYAATGAATVREYPVGADSEAVWIGGGVGHAVTARLPYSPQITVSGGRERTMFRFSGRPKPVVYAGEGISRVVDSNGMILVDDAENTQPDDLILVAQNEEPTHLYRDPDGRYVTGMLTDIQVARQSHAHWAYSFQLEESEG